MTWSTEYPAISRLEDESPAEAAVVERRGAPRLVVNGEDVFPLAGWSWALEDAAYYFHRAGIRILHPILGLNSAWPEPDQFDWSLFDRHFDQLLITYPDAFFLPRVLLDVPDWWRDRYPDELVETAIPPVPDNPRQYRQVRINPESGFAWGIQLKEPSLASEKWSADMSLLVRAFLEHVNESPLVSRVIGYQIGAGIYGEWHYFLAEFMPDCGKPIQARVDFIPDAEARIKSKHGLFRDPVKEKATIDYYRFLHRDVISERLLQFAGLVKEITSRRVVVGAFENYLLENVWIQEGGHLDPESVLASPDIDFVASPYSYQTTNLADRPWWEHDVEDDCGNWMGRARGVGGDGGYRVLLESLRRAGKLYFAEIDPSTYLEPPPSDNSSDIERELPLIGGVGSTTPTGTRNILRRDLGRLLASGTGGWLFDFGPVMATGKSWYADEPIISTLKPLAALGEARTRFSLEPVSEIAAVYDARSPLYTRHWMADAPFERGSVNMDYFSHWFLDTQVRSIHRIGAPVDFLYHFDLEDQDPGQYRLFLAVNLFYQTNEDVTRLRRRLAGSRATVVWYYAPAYVGAEGINLNRMSALTGFTFERVGEPRPFLIDTQIEAADVEECYGVASEEWPRFHVVDSEARVFGTWADSGKAALAVKEVDGWRSVYTGAAPLPVGLLRWLTDLSGARLWSSKPDVVVACEDIAMITATSSGERRVSLPKTMVGLDLDEKNDRFSMTMEEGEVSLFASADVAAYRRLENQIRR